jgi:hypothetical protein
MCKLNKPSVLFAASSNATPKTFNISTARPNSACRPVTLHISPDALSLSRGLSRRKSSALVTQIRNPLPTAHRDSTLEPREVCSPSESHSAGGKRKEGKKQKEFPERTTASHHRNVRPNFVPLRCVRCASHSHLSFCTLRPCHLPMSNPPPPCHRQACPWTPRQAECRLIIDI